jgi:hypothetical protein
MDCWGERTLFFFYCILLKDPKWESNICVPFDKKGSILQWSTCVCIFGGGGRHLVTLGNWWLCLRDISQLYLRGEKPVVTLGFYLRAMLHSFWANSRPVNFFLAAHGFWAFSTAREFGLYILPFVAHQIGFILPTSGSQPAPPPRVLVF